jgi:hypothetical protein
MYAVAVNIVHKCTMAYCCVVFSTNDSPYKQQYLEETGNPVHFHHFPSDVQKKREWIAAIRRQLSITHTPFTASSRDGDRETSGRS